MQFEEVDAIRHRYSKNKKLIALTLIEEYMYTNRTEYHEKI